MLRFSDEFLDREDHGMLLASRILPLSVQVLTNECASRIAEDHTVRIDHWYYLEDVIVPQYSCSNTGSNQVINDAFLHIGSASLTRMHSRRNYDGLLLLHLLIVITESRDREQVAWIACIRLA